MGQIQKEISVTAENKPGTLAKAAGCLKEEGVSIQAACAWGEGGKATFMFLTDNNTKAMEALRKGGYSATEEEVVTSVLANRIGSFAEATHKMGQAGIDINYCYVSASGPNALAVFATNNNQKAKGLLP
ncbi:MAG: hypothetical protein HYT76_08315 [Deltaproteobacteria bacterium]|nr:hypothetical protein [Deltaproteobacteria bacterium]